jgi:hypothetical protein
VFLESSYSSGLSFAAPEAGGVNGMQSGISEYRTVAYMLGNRFCCSVQWFKYTSEPHCDTIRARVGGHCLWE